MRYSNYIGVVAALLLIIGCFSEWVYIASVHASITGFQTAPTGIGKPGLVHTFFAVLASCFFLLPYVSVKRINLFVGALNLAWCFRNYLIITQCQMGECPEKKFGIYLILVSSAVLFVMTLLPKLRLNEPAEQQ